MGAVNRADEPAAEDIGLKASATDNLERPESALHSAESCERAPNLPSFGPAPIGPRCPMQTDDSWWGPCHRWTASTDIDGEHAIPRGWRDRWRWGRQIPSLVSAVRERGTVSVRCRYDHHGHRRAADTQTTAATRHSGGAQRCCPCRPA